MIQTLVNKKDLLMVFVTFLIIIATLILILCRSSKKTMLAFVLAIILKIFVVEEDYQEHSFQ